MVNQYTKTGLSELDALPWRNAVCRRPGCAEPAEDETLLLCKTHRGSYDTWAARPRDRKGNIVTSPFKENHAYDH